MRRLTFENAFVVEGASFASLEDGAARVVTRDLPWSNAVGLPVDPGHVSSGLFALVACRRGEIGVGLVGEDGSTHLGQETIIAEGATRLVRTQVDSTGHRACWLMIRNGRGRTVSECDVLALLAGSPSQELTANEVATALRDPARARARYQRRIWPGDVIEALGAASVPVEITRSQTPLRVPGAQELWSGSDERVVLRTADDLIALLEDFRADALDPHVAVLEQEAMRSYLRMNVVRVVRLVELLKRRGLDQGKVVEVGAWFGSFALALQRLGYDVVAADRYTSYGDAFDSYVELMEREGVRVVSTDRARELEQLPALGEFDAVLAGAVIEHVPHTPRLLLEAMFAMVRPGGLLLLDTPNVARYWNRRALEAGDTIFQPLEQQFYSQPPWEGHHREYTAPELRWMLERVGCDDVEVEFLDYNMLQFAELSAEHIECLATIVEDPSQSDTLLAAGRRPRRSSSERR